MIYTLLLEQFKIYFTLKFTVKNIIKYKLVPLFEYFWAENKQNNAKKENKNREMGQVEGMDT